MLSALSLAVTCLECKSTSDTYEPYLDLALEIGVGRQGGGWGGALLSWGCSCSCSIAALRAPEPAGAKAQRREEGSRCLVELPSVSGRAVPGAWARGSVVLGALQLPLVVLGSASWWGSGLCCSLWPRAQARCGLSGLWRGQATGGLSSPLSVQEATSVVQALGQFVQAELLCGENAYKCAR